MSSSNNHLYSFETIALPEEFDKKVTELQQQGKTICLYFTGTKNPKTKRSWCPDCIAHEPKVKNMLASLPKEKQEKLVMVECLVEREPYKGENKDQYYYRKHEDLKICSVPTFIIWEYDQTSGKCTNTEKRLWKDSDFHPENLSQFKQNF